jgi:hypothetical protein
LRQHLRVLARQRGAGRVQPLCDAVEIRAADGGAGLDDAQAIRREHERGRGRAHAFERGDSGAVDLRVLPFTDAERNLEGHGAGLAQAVRPDVEPIAAEADEVRVEPRPR